MNNDLSRIRNASAGRVSSWNTNGRNDDCWYIDPGESRILADIEGPGAITHIWMTQKNHYRECLLTFTWDDATEPSVVCPLGDFFGLGHNIVNSYESQLFTASTNQNNQFDQGCALNCYVRMPFRRRSVIAIVNESSEIHRQFFYVDYESSKDAFASDSGYFHTEFRRENPFGGWGPEIRVNAPESSIVNTERTAWENNYLILDTSGRGHYIGCNISVTNFQGSWWGEGDDMIWVDGYKWPPDIHGTGSEDYLNQAYGMQPNAFQRNGSSIYEHDTNGYQTSYVHHLENPVHFNRDIKVTMEHGHGNHLCNEMSSAAYWYAAEPSPVATVPAMTKRLPVLRDNQGNWMHDPERQTSSRTIEPNEEMQGMKDAWREKQGREGV